MKLKIIKNNKGFSLIEIMIVVAILGILSQLTYWMYNMYIIRAQVAETFSLVTALQRLVNMFYQENGRYPNNMSDLTTDTLQGKYVDSVELIANSNPSIIQVTFGNDANIEIAGQTLNFQARLNPEGNLVWTCIQGTISRNYIPSVCEKI